MIALEISRRNARVKAPQNQSNRMRQIIDECGASAQFGDVPGGSTGSLPARLCFIAPKIPLTPKYRGLLPPPGSKVMVYSRQP